MKTLYKFSIIFAIAILCACKKSFLEVTPKGKLIAQKTADYNLLLSNLDLVTFAANAQVPMGDEIAAIEPYFNGTGLKTQRLFRWEDVIYEPAEDASELKAPFQNIYTFNKIIDEVPKSIDGTEQQKFSIAAEAMAGRAWTYFLLINYFGKPYNNTTSTTDPGLPILKEADVTETKFTRASVKEVYDFIVSDLTAAIPNLPVSTTHRLRMSKAAGEGLLAKVYMFMGRFNDALPLLNNALTDINNNTALPVRLYDYNVTFAPGGAFLPFNIFGPAYPLIANNTENVFGKQTGNSWMGTSNELIITKQTADLFVPTDLRLKFYSTNVFQGPAYPNGMLRRIGTGITQFGVVLPDLYLLRAECKARLNDLSGAVSDLETLRKNRMPAGTFVVPGGVASQQLALLKYIMEERIREFAVQGYRWFDMRRLSVDPLFSNATYTHTLFSSTGTVSATYTLKPERLVLRLPQKVMDENPGMQNNP